MEPPGWLTSRWASAVAATAVATVLSICWLVLPHGGSDLAAQVAHADFFATHGWTPVDLRWFGGTDVLGYSVLSPAVMAAIGVPAAGVLATIVASGVFGALLARADVPYPGAGAVVGALFITANLVVGRISFEIGLAAALVTLLIASFPAAGWRLALIVVGTVVTWALSPLALLFLAMVAVALLASGRARAAIAVLAPTAVGFAAMLAVGGSGIMPMSAWDLARALIACAVAAALTRYRSVRVVAALSGLSVVVAYALSSPLGVNATRFAAIFAVPVAVSTCRLDWRRAALPLLVAVVILPPLTPGDLMFSAAPADQATYFTPLTDELARLPLSGRVEVVPTRNRWEATYVARRVPLARGWMTQEDRVRNPLFFGGRIPPTDYHRWLRANAVQYVALSDATPSWVGVDERNLVLSRPTYLRQVWAGPHWRLFTVVHPTATVEGARLLTQTAAAVQFQADRPGRVLVRVQWSRWLTLQGPPGQGQPGCLAPAGRWTTVTVYRSGTFEVGSRLFPGDRHQVC